MSVIVQANPKSPSSELLTEPLSVGEALVKVVPAEVQWLELQRRGWLCLVAAVLWVAPHFFLSRGATHSLGNLKACLVLAAGAALSFLAVALCYGVRGTVDRLRSRVSVWSVSLVFAMLPLGTAAYQVLKLSHHRPLGAVLLAVVSLGAVAAISLLVRGGLHWFSPHKSNSRDNLLPKTVPVLVVVGAVAALAIVVPRLVLTPGQSMSDDPGQSLLEGLWVAFSHPSDIVLGAFLAALVACLPVVWIPRALARLAVLGHLGLMGGALWLIAADPSLIETLRSAPVVSGILGFLLS